MGSTLDILSGIFWGRIKEKKMENLKNLRAGWGDERNQEIAIKAASKGREKEGFV